MKFKLRKLAYCLFLGLIYQNSFAEETKTNEIFIPIEKNKTPTVLDNVVPLSELHPETARDGAQLINQIPGAAVLRNGQQTGIVQVRGLSHDRVNVIVDGMQITPACPNHMDPPMHYMTQNELKQLEVWRGIAPVSQAGDHIGGAVVANSATPRFAQGDQKEIYGQAKANFNGSNNSKGLFLDVGLATDSVGLRYQSERQVADDLKFNGGTVRASGYQITKNSLDVALKKQDHLFTLGASAQRSHNVGTPALGMDMGEDRADRIKLGYQTKIGNATLDVKAYDHKIDHVMTNYAMRNVPVGSMPMAAPATSKNTGVLIGVNLSAKEGQTYRFGFEKHNLDFDVYSQNMVNNLRQQSFNQSTRDRTALYLEWEQVSNQWKRLIGIRHETVKMDTGAISQVMNPMMVMADQTAFNKKDRNKTDQNLNWNVQLQYLANEQLSYEFGIARQVRSPSVVERYIWTPSNTYGLADGRSYLGNVDLKPEVSHQIQVGAKWQSEQTLIYPKVFWNHVKDYIQGTPIARLDSNRLAVLQFNNVPNVELYGFEVAFAQQLGSNLRLDGDMSYVRGKNKDSGDNLYRIAPLRAHVNLNYKPNQWHYTMNLELVSRQDKVSSYNGETQTGGYGLVHLRAAYQPFKQTKIQFGVENLFDKYYADHLSGLNRVANSDVGVGQRLPGAGRFVYLSVSQDF